MQPVVMLVIAGVAMFSVIGGVSLLSHYYTLNGIKSRTVGDGQHGTARFATKKEIAETYVQVPYEPELWRRGENLPTAQGLVLGSMERVGKLYALVDTGDVHCLMIGAAGVGKTAHFLYPNIEYACACGMSFLTTDTKGDLYRNYAGIAKKYYGYHTAVIDLRNPTRSDGDNMLHLVNKYMDEYLADHTNLSAKAKAEKYAKITAKTIISSGGTDSIGNRFCIPANDNICCIFYDRGCAFCSPWLNSNDRFVVLLCHFNLFINPFAISGINSCKNDNATAPLYLCLYCIR